MKYKDIVYNIKDKNFEKIYLLYGKEHYLIDNAIKYCNKGGKILVSTKVKNEKVIVSVYNNGPCIKEEDLKYIWDRFYKADKSRTNKTSTGLGLPIVRNIILQHNEEIWIDNTDKGVSFSFTLKRIKDD